MKKLLVLLLVPSLSFGVAITATQIVQVSTTTQAIQSTANQMATLAAAVSPLIVSSNTYTLYFSTNTVSLSASLQTDIVNYYTTIKNQLKAQVNSLP